MKKFALLGTLLLTLGTMGLPQVEPLGIIIEPPEPEGLSVRIWVDKPVYTLQEKVRIHFEINQDAYVYIWDIDPAGKVTLLLPNYYEPDNFFRAGAHTIPSPGKGYSFGFAPGSPTGTEWLQIMATTQPVPALSGGFSVDIPFPLLGEDPESWRARLEVQIQGLVPEPTDRAFDFTSFEVISGAPPAFGTLQVTTNPSFARLYIDGVFRGWTPRSLNLVQGFHDVLIRKAGYQDYSTRVYIVGGRTRTLNITLTPLATNQPPVARFTYSPTNPQPGQWIQFDASSSYDPDGTITSYQWDFDGDGAFDATGPVVYYRFGAAGTYSVRLRVTDDAGATGEGTRPVTVQVANQPPVARFTFSPSLPLVGQPVTFNATSSYDPDGTITSFSWDLDGDGAVDHFGPVVTSTYYAAGIYSVTLYVTDNLGATGQTTQPVQIAPVGIPGMPPMDGMPGIYVWGSDSWHITVNGSPTWTTPHAFRLELRTDGEFVGVTTEAGPAPLGLVPEPTSEGWRVIFDGSVVSDQVTYTFQVRGATSIYMDLKLDMDGDGDLERSPGFVHLRQFMVSPPANPFVVGTPEGYSGPFVPSINFRIGQAYAYSEHVKFVWYSTTIAALEGSS